VIHYLDLDLLVDGGPGTPLVRQGERIGFVAESGIPRSAAGGDHVGLQRAQLIEQGGHGLRGGRILARDDHLGAGGGLGCSFQLRPGIGLPFGGGDFGQASVGLVDRQAQASDFAAQARGLVGMRPLGSVAGKLRIFGPGSVRGLGVLGSIQAIAQQVANADAFGGGTESQQIGQRAIGDRLAGLVVIGCVLVVRASAGAVSACWE
jgi:hypothetical protein